MKPAHLRLGRALFAFGLILPSPSCQPKPTPAVIVAQGIDDERVYVVLEHASVTRPVRAGVEKGRIHFYVKTEPPARSSHRVECQTNEALGTITISAPHQFGLGPRTNLQVFLDGKSLGDWGLFK